MKHEMPFVPGAAPGVRASTRWTICSVMSCSPYVMKIFCPLILHEPSSLGTAFVVSAPTSEPACDSVRFIVAVHSPVIILGKNVAFCSGEP